MRHLKSGRKLGRPASHRKSLLANLATSILDKERIITTLAKAKEARSVVERLITFGKKGGLNSIRIAGKTITDKTVLHKLFSDIAPSFKDREGGYTRIIKLGERKGDNALLAIIELTGRGGEEIARLRKKQRKQGTTPGSTQAQGTGQAAAAKTSAQPATEKAPVAKAEKPSKAKAAEKVKEERPKATEKPKAEKIKAPKKAKTGKAETAASEGETQEKKASATPQAAPQEKTKVKKTPRAEKPKKTPKEKKK